MFLKSFVSCQALAEALKQNSTLTGLNLAFNSICDEVTKAWGEDGVMRGEGVKKLQSVFQEFCSILGFLFGIFF